LGIPPKKEEHHFWVSRLRRAIRKWLKPLDFGYTSKKRRTPFLGLKIKKRNKKMATTLGFWVYLQKKKNPYSWVTGRRKKTKYSKIGNPLDKPTKTLYFRVTTRSKPMVSKTFLLSINPLRITTKSNLGVQIL
jgi:hypothetical protein